LFLTGFGVHFLGYRIAFHVNPELTRAMGGAISIQQKESIEASYKEQVQKLEANIAQVNQKIEELTVIKDQFADIATPAPVKSKSNNLNTK
jgi:hypothetical protein